MTGVDYEKSIVSLVCWKLMHGELYRGMISVAMMLKNRADSGWFEGSIYNNAVALGMDMKLDWCAAPDPREHQFMQLLQAVDGVYSGQMPDKTGGALYLAHASQIDSIAGDITTQVGQFVFFRGQS